MLKTVTIALLLLGIAGSASFCPMSVKAYVGGDEEAYYERAWVHGTVTMMNHPTLGRTPDNGDVIIFQRTDCGRCVVGVRTDLNGRYQLFLSKGRYRVIMRAGTRLGETQDILAPGQARFFDVSSEQQEFDVNVVLRPDHP